MTQVNWIWGGEKGDNKIPDISRYVKKTDYNAKITEIQGKIPRITGLTAAASRTAIGNKVPDVRTLTQIYHTLNLYILLRMIIMNLLVKHLMQR